MNARANGVHTEADHENAPEGMARERVRALARAAVFVREAMGEIRKRPVLATAAAGTLGVVLGGLIVPGLGRLAFVGTMGYFANELWRREGRTHVDNLVAALGGERGETTSSAGGHD